MKCAIIISLLCYLALAGIVSGTEVSVNDTGVAAAANAIANDTTTYIFLQEGTNGSL
jgi:competence protein ComGC